jgi:hypothetical protein
MVNTSPLYFCSAQHRSSSDLTHCQPNGFVNVGTPPFEQKLVTSFVGQPLLEPQHQQQLSNPTASGSGVDMDFAGRDMLRGLGITGLNRGRDRQRPNIIDDRSLEPSPVYNNSYINDGPSGVLDKQQGNEVR